MTRSELLAALGAATGPSMELEAAAEALWQADSLRAASRPRLTSWEDESEETREAFRFNARAAISAADAARPVVSDEEIGAILNEWISPSNRHSFSELLRAAGFVVVRQ